MKYHLIGDQGVSMSAIANLLKSRGHIVTGSDIKTGGHRAKNITKDIDIVVRTSAVNLGSPGWVEVKKAQEIGIPVLKRSELLGQITKTYKLIAISGMHGKTTTTSLVGLIMIEAGMDPTVLIGEHIKEFNNSSLRIGNSDYFVMEACEYDKSFLDFKPHIIILTNIDEEHLDTYPGGINEICDTFKKYITQVRKNGIVIANFEDANIRKVIDSIKEKTFNVIWYGKGSEKYNNFNYDISILGDHNKLNATAVLALADNLDINRNVCRNVFRTFKGAKRRMEYWGEYNNSLLYDDYGHHPTEIKATIKAIKKQNPKRKIIVVFWPHQYKRILPLLNDFSTSFDEADCVYIKEIYFVPGRDEKLDISSLDIVNKINNKKTRAKYFENDTEIIKELKNYSKENTVLLTLGIPPIYKILEILIGEK